MRQCCERLWKDLRDYRAAIVVFILYNVLARSLFHAFCPQLILTGFPCAGCGMTRAIFCFLTGQFSRAMKLNPAAPLWILFLSWFFYNRYARGVYHKSTPFWLGLVCAATLAVYVCRMLYCFPGEPPMVYYRNNMIRKFFLRK